MGIVKMSGPLLAANAVWISSALFFVGTTVCSMVTFGCVFWNSAISSVVFAVIDGDEANKNIRKRLMDEGTVIGQTSKDGKVMLKFTLLNPMVTHDDIDRVIQRIKELRG